MFRPKKYLNQTTDRGNRGANLMAEPRFR